jgi:hypothetical protein
VAKNGIASIPKDNKVRRRLVAKNGIASIPKDNKVRRRLVAKNGIANIPKDNKGNAKRGVSTRLKIRPCDLDL